MKIRDRAKVVVPPCPECGAAVTVNWVDVRAIGDQRAQWVPGQMRCSANEDHDIRPIMAITNEWARERDDWFDSPEMQAAALEGWLNNPVRPIVEAQQGLVPWLLARIEEDERDITSDHSEWDHWMIKPSRVAARIRQAKAECDAKRKIIEMAEWLSNYSGIGVHALSDLPHRLVLRHMATPYSDRPGYREEWRLA